MRKTLIFSLLAMFAILFASPPDAKASTEKDLTNTTDALIATPDTGPAIEMPADLILPNYEAKLIATPDTGPLQMNTAEDAMPILDTSPGAQIYIDYICTAVDLNAADLAMPLPALRE